MSTSPAIKVGDDVWLVERRPYPARQRIQKFDSAQQRWKHTFVTVTREFVSETPGWTVLQLHDQVAQIRGHRLAQGSHVQVDLTVPLRDLRPSRGAPL